MDCLSCVCKIENVVSNLVGIENVKVLFVIEKLVVDVCLDICF